MSTKAADKNPILSALEAAAHGLSYGSESDFPMKAFFWKKADVGEGDLTSKALTTLVKKPDASVEKVDFTTFFASATKEESWHGEEEKKSVEGFKGLVQTLQKNLSDLQVFKVGSEPKKDVYVVGKTPDGDYAGVSTKVVET